MPRSADRDQTNKTSSLNGQTHEQDSSNNNDVPLGSTGESERADVILTDSNDQQDKSLKTKNNGTSIGNKVATMALDPQQKPLCLPAKGKNKRKTGAATTRKKKDKSDAPRIRLDRKRFQEKRRRKEFREALDTLLATISRYDSDFSQEAKNREARMIGRMSYRSALSEDNPLFNRVEMVNQANFTIERLTEERKELEKELESLGGDLKAVKAGKDNSGVTYVFHQGVGPLASHEVPPIVPDMDVADDSKEDETKQKAALPPEAKEAEPSSISPAETPIEDERKPAARPTSEPTDVQMISRLVPLPIAGSDTDSSVQKNSLVHQQQSGAFPNPSHQQSHLLHQHHNHAFANNSNQQNNLLRQQQNGMLENHFTQQNDQLLHLHNGVFTANSKEQEDAALFQHNSAFGANSNHQLLHHIGGFVNNPNWDNHQLFQQQQQQQHDEMLFLQNLAKVEGQRLQPQNIGNLQHLLTNQYQVAALQIAPPPPGGNQSQTAFYTAQRSDIYDQRLAMGARIATSPDLHISQEQRGPVDLNQELQCHQAVASYHRRAALLSQMQHQPQLLRDQREPQDGGVGAGVSEADRQTSMPPSEL